MNTKELPEKVNTGDTLQGVQLCPFGDWPNGGTVQKCDEAAFNKLVADWRATGGREVICDFEHRFQDPSLTSDTSAAAWISNLSVNKERGLVGDLKFTDAGAAAVSSRRLRFLSPVWTLDAEGRPDRLLSVALTNKPNIPVACVLNRSPQPVITTVEEPKETPMDELKKLLGLAATASDADVVAAVKALKDQVAALNKEKESAEAESFAEQHKAVCNKEALKAAYLMNKEAAQKLVDGFVKPVDGKTAIPNKPALESQGKTPEVKVNKAAGDARAAMAALPPAERAKYYKEHAEEIG